VKKEIVFKSFVPSVTELLYYLQVFIPFIMKQCISLPRKVGPKERILSLIPFPKRRDS
jgi:hypothetical protein